MCKYEKCIPAQSLMMSAPESHDFTLLTRDPTSEVLGGWMREEHITWCWRKLERVKDMTNWLANGKLNCCVFLIGVRVYGDKCIMRGTFSKSVKQRIKCKEPKRWNQSFNDVQDWQKVFKQSYNILIIPIRVYLGSYTKYSFQCAVQVRELQMTNIIYIDQ